MKQFAKIAAVLAALVLACAFVACGDEDDGDSVVCTWKRSGSSDFYVFYADKTVEGWLNNKLEYPRNTLSYTGNPIANGTVEIKTISGVTMFKFTVSGDVATESTSRRKYDIYIGTADDDDDVDYVVGSPESSY